MRSAFTANRSWKQHVGSAVSSQENINVQKSVGKNVKNNVQRPHRKQVLETAHGYAVSPQKHIDVQKIVGKIGKNNAQRPYRKQISSSKTKECGAQEGCPIYASCNKSAWKALEEYNTGKNVMQEGLLVYALCGYITQECNTNARAP
eukprot:1161325-Pelagomonas_calceolata.AAC.24